MVGSGTASCCAARLEGGTGVIICLFSTTEVSGVVEDAGGYGVAIWEEDWGLGTVQARFRATGLVPFSQEQVLDQLHVQLGTLNLPLIAAIAVVRATRTHETPDNVVELENQAIQAINSLVQGCALATEKLRAANEQVVKRLQKRKSHIRYGGVLRVVEAQRGSGSRAEKEIIVTESSNVMGSVLAPRMCRESCNVSGCSVISDQSEKIRGFWVGAVTPTDGLHYDVFTEYAYIVAITGINVKSNADIVRGQCHRRAYLTFQWRLTEKDQLIKASTCKSDPVYRK
ncbi:hypothetical protein GcC1_014028 [Golovinomyces cichoracearum]|uniref:Uncharacterized protein n=1 Tax=Golovinomyces cichoracearum TaxID=62708 RepID=A0A420J6T0_9PEZI|nr:hypothetical protein GcC1_014028 [Golovinomyces cichoracearum]